MHVAVDKFNKKQQMINGNKTTQYKNDVVFQLQNIILQKKKRKLRVNLT